MPIHSLAWYFFSLSRVPLGVLSVAAAMGLARFARLTPALRYLTLLACFDVLAEVSGFLVGHLLQSKSNLFLFPIVIVGEAGFLLLLYNQVLQSAAFQRAARWIFGLLVAYALMNSLLVIGTIRFWPSLQVLGNLLSLSLAGLYFRKLLNELLVVHLEREPLFWLSVGLIISSLGDLFISLFSNYLLANYSSQFNLMVWNIHAWLTGLLYASYCLALWPRPAKQPLGTPAVA